MKVVKFVVKDGQVQLKTEGFEGPVCVSEAERIYELMSRLGVEVGVEKIVPTEEYYVKNRAVHEGKY